MRWLRLPLRIALVTTMVAIAAWYCPTSYILRAPGHADDLAPIVHVRGGHPLEAHSLLMTTIIYEKANLLFCFYSLFDRDAMLVPDEDAVSPHVFLPRPSGLPYLRSPEDVMAFSKDTARVVALRKLGYDIKVESTGARVVGFLAGVPSASHLQLDDVIDEVDGTRVRTVPQLRQSIRGRKPGDAVTVKLRRAGKAAEASFALASHGGRPMLGIVSQDAIEHSKLPVDIDIVTHNVNGASAGLMFTLAIIDQLTPGGITKGNVVAGTGTIEMNGNVGPIEGVDLKLVAARRAGATVFLVPLDNYSEAKDKGDGMKLIPVQSVDDALQALKALR